MRLVALLLVLLLGLARAGDAATLEFWGFSRDGKYLAFEQYGVQDGSGFPYAQLYVVDVGRNALVSTAEVTVQTGNAGVETARERALAQSRPALSPYAIVPGNQGRFASIAAKNLLPNVVEPQAVEFTALGRRYTLELRSLDAPGAGGSCLTEPPKRLELKLISSAGGRVLQRDNNLPASRRCVRDYEIHGVFVLGRSLAAFVKVTRDGFEGPDLRWMVVTARLGLR